MKAIPYILTVFTILCWSCEDKIDINLNDADPKLVIVGDLTNLSDKQQIRVSRTVAFNETVNSLPVNDAKVEVSEVGGRVFVFQSAGQNGIYSFSGMPLREGKTYRLSVQVGDDLYESESTVPKYVQVEQFGIKEETIFGETYKMITFGFNDPANLANYYRYLISVNSGPLEFSTVLSDKFNDGLSVTHDIANEDNDLKSGDEIVIRRQCVDRGVYRYWNEFQSTNPGSASPANPTSNISNGALGYFSASSAQEYKTLME
ncbi:DUF4249 domain-containing protein [Sphingobacterium sp. SYP-B4668]|uniref:DUF4249 domain-containing protein n=1 Tax=Sphingobacterium sp. SYP-B4668 TaxID=2996035 RepID=UPI00053265B4|nr:DUF4249 domain-containing protein [Sphingobacterium sp. SYP-B4668]